MDMTKLCFLPPDLVPKVALVTPNRLSVNIKSKKIHATYLRLGYPSIYTHYWISSGGFLLKYFIIVLFTPPDLVPKGALITPKRFCVDINSKKIHATYLRLGYPSIFTHYWISSGGFLLKYFKIVLFTPRIWSQKGICGPEIGNIILRSPFSFQSCPILVIPTVIVDIRSYVISLLG